MKYLKYIVLALLVCVAMGAEAKTVKARHMYVFGFAASFKDSVVYMTEIQDVQGAMYDTKTKFLLGRDSYSDQLKTYFRETMQMPNRVCMVMFSTSKKKAEKQYLKLRSKYLSKKHTSSYEVRYVTMQDFKFEPVGLDE
jgi:hypothetical protein